jgi:hypothetical protein
MTPKVEIRRRSYAYHYARNGNVGMTNTAKYTWDVYVDNKLAIPGIPTLREAKTFAARRGAFKVVR